MAHLEAAAHYAMLFYECGRLSALLASPNRFTFLFVSVCRVLAGVILTVCVCVCVYLAGSYSLARARPFFPSLAHFLALALALALTPLATQFSPSLLDRCTPGRRLATAATSRGGGVGDTLHTSTARV